MRPATERHRRDLLTRAKRVVGKRYTEFDFVLRDVAEEIGTSRRELQRVFAEIEGENFRSYLLRVRMERARALLERPGTIVSVEGVATRVGYRRASGLRQAFVRFWGVNPSQVRPEWDTEADYSEAWRVIEAKQGGP